MGIAGILPVQNRTLSVLPFHKMGQASFLSYLDKANETGRNPELLSIEELSKSYSVGKPDATNFADAFTRYDVNTHIGNADISDAVWQRNDFPIWRYFDKNASAECLNGWTPTGPNPPQTDSRVQRGLSSIGAGKMAVIIPEALQKKMDADPKYAKEIMAKVQKWKEDYDNWDNATALSLGMNVVEHQASKNYLINLDEDGNVKQYAVSGGGGRITGPSKEDQKKFEEQQKAKREQKIKEEKAYKEYLRKIAEQQRIYAEESMRARSRELVIQEQFYRVSESQGLSAVYASSYSSYNKEV